MRTMLVAVAILPMLNGCEAMRDDPPEIAACDAYTRQLLSEPAGYRRTGVTTIDEPVTLAGFKDRAGYRGADRTAAELGAMTLDLDRQRARSEGGAGALGIRSVSLTFDGGTSNELPAGKNVCAFRTIDGAVQSQADLDRAVERAMRNRMMQQARTLAGPKVPAAFSPDVPCCLVP